MNHIPILDFDSFAHIALEYAVNGGHNSPIQLSNDNLINGFSHSLYRKLVEVNERKKYGAFFTSGDMSRKLLKLYKKSEMDNKIILDPTSGVGDLLVNAANFLPVCKSLEGTLSNWGDVLYGVELQKSLVILSKARLIALARNRGKFFNEKLDPSGGYFSNIVEGDFFDNSDKIKNAKIILFNPPFGYTRKNINGEWARGQKHTASVFLEFLLMNMDRDSSVAAILPEVLRSGERYKRFRKFLKDLGYCGSFCSLGQFDRWADVDVFTTRLSKRRSRPSWLDETQSKSKFSIQDKFNVHVGPVVPHRHKNAGPAVKYVCAKSTPRGDRAFEAAQTRGFKGTLYKPPFVVIRRTSSPADQRRVAATIVIGSDSVAVENHLIIVQPSDHSYDECVRVCDLLESEHVNDFINRNLRCRHLTVGLIKRMPLKCNEM